MHKCSAYCKRKVKRGGIFISSCKFNFPRKPCDTAALHCVEEKLKKRQNIYELKCRKSKVLHLAESLCHWLCNKTEKSSLQEMWQETSDNSTSTAAYGNLAFEL